MTRPKDRPMNWLSSTLSPHSHSAPIASSHYLLPFPSPLDPYTSPQPLQKAALPLDEIDLCDVAHQNFHDFSLEIRSILATVCDNKHSTWHASHSCVTSLCNTAGRRGVWGATQTGLLVTTILNVVFAGSWISWFCALLLIFVINSYMLFGYFCYGF